MIPVTRPFLPPKEKYTEYISDIWKRDWLTNMGPLSNELELKLKKQLAVQHLLYVSNGTIALQLAIRALNLSGEIITTPFSFIATTSSIVWEGCEPVFVDIDPLTLNIDPASIEAAITDRTSAILATHVYGNPCDVERIQDIANRHGLKVIYDGAHAFGVKLDEVSIFNYGDISICSLHATKLYHSVEGGLLITKDPRLLGRLAHMRNFGFDGPEAFSCLGINGKNSEFHAAMGLVNLEYISDILEKRKGLTLLYRRMLNTVNIAMPTWHLKATRNYSYFPVIFESRELTLKCFNALERKEVYARRYFYPSLAKILPYLPKRDMPVTDDISERVLCLPLYYDLSAEEVRLICRVILRNIKYS